MYWCSNVCNTSLRPGSVLRGYYTAVPMKEHRNFVAHMLAVLCIRVGPEVPATPAPQGDMRFEEMTPTKLT